MAKQLKITQVRSLIGSLPKHKRTMEAIGFRRHQQTLVKNDTAQLRGMLRQISHLVVIEESGTAAKVEASASAKTEAAAASAEATTKPKAAASKAKAAPKAKVKAKAKKAEDKS